MNVAPALAQIVRADHGARFAAHATHSAAYGCGQQRCVELYRGLVRHILQMVFIRPVRSVALCGSMRVIAEMIGYAKQLNEWGITTHLPTLDEPVDYSTLPENERGIVKAQLIRNHIEKIENSDAVLICNLTMDDRIDYIGANSFLEMGFAFAFGKVIYLLNDVPDQPNTDEIFGLLPISLNGDLARIRH